MSAQGNTGIIMKAIGRCIFVLLPFMVVGALWLMAEDRQQNARVERALQYVPPMRVAERPDDTLRLLDTTVDAGAELLRTLLPATISP